MIDRTQLWWGVVLIVVVAMLCASALAATWHGDDTRVRIKELDSRCELGSGRAATIDCPTDAD